METVAHQGRETAYRSTVGEGDGRPLLCVHGSGGSHAVWSGQYRLKTERPIAALDLSGHGDSEDVEADSGWEALSAYADDVSAVAQETDAGVLVGSSLGGAILLHLAIEREFEPDAMVLCGTSAKLPMLEDLLVWLRDDFERAVTFLHEPGHLFYDRDERYVERSRTVMRETGQRVTRRDFETCHTFDVRGELDRLDAPCLVVVGEHDRLVPRSYQENLVEELPDAELAVIEETAHLSMLERPEAFNAVVSDFLARRC